MSSPCWCGSPDRECWECQSRELDSVRRYEAVIYDVPVASIRERGQRLRHLRKRRD